MRADIYATLKTLQEAEKPAYLLSVGYEESEIPDLLASLKLPGLMMGKRSQEHISFTASPVFESITDRIARMEREAKERATTHKPETDPQENAFQRDILLNRYLMGGSTIYDDASLHNPGLRKTEVINWLVQLKPKVALVIGDPGSGKTWGLLAYMNSLTTCKGAVKVEYADSAFITAFRLAEMFHNQKKFQLELDDLMRKKLLLIDDLGAEPSGFRGADFIAYFDYLFSERHKFRRSTFLTSNAEIEKVKALYGDRFVSRFNESGNFLETTDNDMRTGKSE